MTSRRNNDLDVRSLQRQTAYLTSHLNVVPSGNFARTSTNYERRPSPVPPQSPVGNNVLMSVRGVQLWQPNLPYGTPRHHLLIDPFQAELNRVESLEFTSNPVITAPYFESIGRSDVYYKRYRIPIPPGNEALAWTRLPYERPQVLAVPNHQRSLGPQQQWSRPGQGILQATDPFFSDPQGDPVRRMLREKRE